MKKMCIKIALTKNLVTGKKRIRGFSSNWKLRKIGELAKCISGGTPSTLVKEYWNGEVKWMSSGELNHKFIFDVSGRITELGLKESSAHMIPEKCVLIGLAGQGKTRGTVAINFTPLSTNQSIAAIMPNENLSPLFLYYCLDSRYDELRDISSGDGGRGGLTLSIINDMVVYYPPIEEQNRIAKILFDIDMNIENLKKKLKKYNRIKYGMMRELLTGRIRLS